MAEAAGKSVQRITRLARAALVAGLLWVSVIGRAHAQAANVVVDVDGALTLTCLETIVVNLDATAMAAAFAGGGTSVSAGATTGTGAVAGNTIGVTLATPSTGFTGNTSSYVHSGELGCRIDYPFGFQNYNVSVALRGNPLLQGSGNSRVRFNAIRAKAVNVNMAYTNSFNFNAFIYTLFGLNPLFIEFEFDLNLSNVTAAGLHSANNPRVMTVTVTSL